MSEQTKHDIAIGRWRLRWWRPLHPTKFGTHENDGMHVVSLRWVMIRWFRKAPAR